MPVPLEIKAIWFILLSLLGSLERVHHAREATRSATIGINAHQSEVLQRLGAPDYIYPARPMGIPFSNSPKPMQWLYGTSLNLQYLYTPWVGPNPFPVNLRIFAFAQDDLVIDWNDEGHVAQINTPHLVASESELRWLRPLDFLWLISQLFQAEANSILL